MGEYEPDDSRKVTGTGSGGPTQQGVRSPGGADQQVGGERWSGQSGQQSQFESGSSGQMGGSADAGTASRIREHMEVIGADGVHVGTVDAVEGHRIKLTKRDSDAGYEGGTHSGHHHYLSCGLVAEIEGDKVRLSANGDVAYGMLEEE
ncbi:hypothetical protein SAMN05660666_00994 [Novosphingobium aromaticivorans]|nr:hypothetical protein SAMN05660666_00994 [Novosphingobium aromaticivorans]